MYIQRLYVYIVMFTHTVLLCLSVQVSDATGSMALTMVSDKSPFCQELLERDDCFILDNGYSGKIYVWKGG